MKNVFLYLLSGLMLMLSISTVVAQPVFQQIDFIDSIAATKPSALTADLEGNLYLTTADGKALSYTADGTLLRQYGLVEKGQKPLLKKAAGIAFADNIVYVTDNKLDKVVLFTTNGDFIDEFGKSGSKAKQFDEPTDIEVRDQIVYVVDSGNSRIQLFGLNGVFLREVGRSGSETQRLKKPVDLTIDDYGRLYVVDKGDSKVKIYSQTDEFLGTFEAPTKPSSLAVTVDSVFVADSKHHSITRIFFDKRPASTFGVKGSSRAQFKEISGLFVNQQGHLFVADRKNNNIQSFALTLGAALDPISKMPAPTWVEWLNSAEMNASKLFWDAAGNRLLAVDEKSRTLNIHVTNQKTQVISLPKWNPVAAAVDPEGNIWVVEKSKHRLLKLAGDGTLLLEAGKSGSREGYFAEPMDLAITGDGIIYIADKGNHRVQAFNTDGVFLSSFGSGGDTAILRSPIAIQIDDNGDLFVLDKGHRKVIQFTPEGKAIREFGNVAKDPGFLEKPVALALIADEIMVLDAGLGCVKVFGVDGAFRRLFGAAGSGNGDFNKPSTIVGIDKTEIIVIDSKNSRLQRFFTHYTPASVAGFKAVSGMRQVQLEWEASLNSDLVGYAIYRADKAVGPYRLIARTNVNGYTDTDVQPKQTYFYRLGIQTGSGQESARTEATEALPERGQVADMGEVQADPQEWSVTLSWSEKEQAFLDHYNIYLQVNGVFSKVGESKKAQFIVPSLEPSTEYHFQVSAVSIDAIETDPVEVDATTMVATRPPIEIVEIDIADVFSNTYKIYEDEGIGSLRIANNTGARISSLKISFAIKAFMDYPSEVELRDIEPRSTRDVVLKAVFNNKILDVTEDTPVQTSIELSYYENGELQRYTRNHAINIFEKHRLMWDVRERFATFVTPKDEVVLEFVRSIVTQYPEINDPILYAGGLYDALGVIGLKYLQDPSNPYQVTSGKTDFVDYIQYPRETLQRRSGDCDDLVALYSTMLESLGIRTKVIEVPGHMLMMFETEFTPADRAVAVADLFVEHEGFLWVPVEVTLVGSSFLKAWEQGSTVYAEWVGRGLTTMNIRQSWGKYKPASLAKSDWRPKEVSRSDIDAKFDEFKMLKKIRMSCITKEYVDRARQEPDNFEPLLQLGIIYANEGELDESLKLLEKARALAPEHSAILNNLGNIYFLKENYIDAADRYSAAADIESDDPYILVNLSRSYLKLEQREDAATIFSRALELAPEIAAKYRTIALELMGSL